MASWRGYTNYLVEEATMKKLSPILLLTAWVLAMTLAACGRSAASQPAGGSSTSDPFAYCSAVGTIDAPDARYTGVPVPESIVQGYLKAAGLVDNGEPSELLQKATFWRCMNGSVYACNIGANLPCGSKADTNKTPTQAMQDFCKANPDADAIPMSVTGHATIYSWACVKDSPKLLEQINQVDAAGYSTSIWYKIAPNP
jgi:hypothetical protein